MTAATVGYAAFLETLPEVALVVDAAGVVRLANGRARALLGEPLPALPLRAASATTTVELTAADGSRVTGRVRTNPVTLDGEVLTVALLSDDRDDERLQQAVKLVGTMGFFDHDQVNDRIYVSGEYRRVAGYSPDEVVTVASLLERVHPDDRPRLLEAIARAHDPASDGAFNIEYRLLRPDGEVRWLAARSCTFFEGTGPARRPVRTVGAGLDVTRRRAEEAEIRTWAQAVESALTGLAIADLSGRLTFVNAAFLRMWGLARESDAVGRSALEFWAAPDEAARVLSGLSTSPAWSGDLLARRADGTTFPTLFSASVVFDASGKPANLLGSFVDITERKQAEAERARLAALLDATPDVVAVVRLDGQLVYANRAARRIRGLAEGETVRVVRFGEGLEPGAREKLRAGIEVALRQGTWWGQITLHESEGAPLEYSLLVQAQGEGEQRTLAFMGRDVTQQRQLEGQLRQSQKMEAVGRLAGGVAHDFNNLLTVINANCELLLADQLLPAQLKDDVQMVLSAGQSAAQLTRQLLAFSRKQVLQPITLDLNELMAHVEKMLRRVIGEDVELVTHRAPGLWATRVDRGQMEQVLVNLAVNARDAMPGGGKLTLETGNVTLDAEYASKHAEVTPGEYVLLAVTDSGTGIEREVLHKVFEPFFTTKGSRGTGLGLSTVYGIVRQSGGHVNVYSEPGRGTTFKLYLPRDRSAPGPAVEPPPRVVRQVEPATVLVVEDSEGVRELVRKYLEARGHTVLSAGRAEDALSLVEHHHGPLDLLITDVVMPGLGGRELADRLRKERPSLQVLYMSGYTENAIVHHGVLDAGLDFIAKPFAIDAFGRQVDELLLRRAK